VVADQVEGGQQESNGASTSPEAQLAADRAAFVAGDRKDPAAAKPGAGAADDDDLDAELDGDEDAVVADDEEDPDADLEADDEDDEEEVDLEEPKDAERAKRLAQVQKTEKRMRDSIAKERKDFETERDSFVAQWKPRIEAVEKFEQLKSKLTPYTTVEMLTELGMSEDDFEQAAQVIYAHSKKGTADPKNREAIARSKRERELADEVKALKAKVTQREEAEEAEKQTSTIRAEIDRYVGDIEKQVTTLAAKLPLAAKHLATAPKSAKQALERIADRITKETGNLPTAKAVAIAYEKERRQLLREHGIDPKAVGAADAKLVKAAPKAGEKKAVEKKTADEEALTRDEFVRARGGNKYS